MKKYLSIILVVFMLASCATQQTITPPVPPMPPYPWLPGHAPKVAKFKAVPATNVIFMVVQKQPPSVEYLACSFIPTTFTVYQSTNRSLALTNWPVFKLVTNVTTIPVGMTGGTNYYYVKTTSTNYTNNVTLAWNESTDPTVVGYNIYYGTTSGVYTSVLTAGNSTNLMVTGLVPGVTYYFAATTYNSSGVQSPFSNEVSYPAPYTPPTYSLSAVNPYWPPFTNLAFTLTATNAASGGKYVQTNLAFKVFMSINLAVPRTNWLFLTNGTGSAIYSVTNLPLYAPQAFFYASTTNKNTPKVLLLRIQGQ